MNNEPSSIGVAVPALLVVASLSFLAYNS